MLLLFINMTKQFNAKFRRFVHKDEIVRLFLKIMINAGFPIYNYAIMFLLQQFKIFNFAKLIQLTMSIGIC